MFAGIDIGSRTAKAVLLTDSTYRWVQSLTEADIDATVRKIQQLAIEAIGDGKWAPSYTVATGYGRVVVPYANETVTEISCAARAAVWLEPEVRLLLDMGGQDCKAIRCDENGLPINFILNEKCAAGTGRYLERVAKALHLPLDEMGPRSLQIVDKPASVSSFCAVLAQNDVLHLIRQGVHPNDILAGACDSVVRRVVTMLQRVGLEGGKVMFCGGVARNIGVVKRLEQQIGREVVIPADPDAVVALGAALIARSRAARLTTVV
ncbi:MAG: fldI 4 [Dehalococcoidales bacterium]|nr:fldI 4 [Dehalococcoidales bacterium]